MLAALTLILMLSNSTFGGDTSILIIINVIRNLRWDRLDSSVVLVQHSEFYFNFSF